MNISNKRAGLLKRTFQIVNLCNSKRYITTKDIRKELNCSYKTSMRWFYAAAQGCNLSIEKLIKREAGMDCQLFLVNHRFKRRNN